MQIASFSKISEMLDQLDHWLKDLGMEPKDDRWHRAADMVQLAQNQRAISEGGGPRAQIDNYIDGLFEAMEIHEIMRAFHGDTSPALKSKLERALCGPISPFDEHSNSYASNRAASGRSFRRTKDQSHLLSKCKWLFVEWEMC